MNMTEIGRIRRAFEKWLTQPEQLGRFPRRADYLKTILDEEKCDCHLVKFQTQLFGRWMLGIVGQSGPFTDYREYTPETADMEARILARMSKGRNDARC